MAERPTKWRTGELAIAVGLCALAGCSSSGALDAQAQRDLPGSIYYLVGAGHDHDHGDATAVERLQLATGAAARVTDGRAPAFVYGLDPSGRTLALTIADDLVLAAPDGSSARIVGSSPELEWYPRFSPDGRQLLFESARASFRDLYTLDVETGAVTRLTDDPQGNFDGAWSPDGRKIAFASSRAGQLDVWVMNADGSDARRLTRHAGDSVKPAWSPSGRYIAFISARDGKDDLYVISADGGAVSKLSEVGPKSGRPWLRPHVQRFAWHPSEDRIAFAARPPRGESQIYTVEVATGASARLSREGHDDREPTWSPGGAYIAFASEGPDGSRIYIMRADGSRRTRLDRAARGAWLPRWVGATTRSDS